MKYIVLILTMAFCSLSCNDWLDVRPDTEQKDKDQFSSVSGFFDALTGCYMTLADKDAYGERLTMSNIEALANLWAMTSSTSREADQELSKHDYTKDYARQALAAMYDKLFHAIVQANMIIKYADEQGHVFTDEAIRKVVQGEAYAIRAYCQLDILRLFGQMPGDAKTQKQLPYSFTTSIYEMPAYYDFAAYVDCLKKDIARAEDLLKDNDPIFEYTFAELNSSADVADGHLRFRQSRLNYWAVKALEARMLLYIGDKPGAYAAAKAVIDAQDTKGNPVMKMSGVADISSLYLACPNECLFYISKYDLLDQATKLFKGGAKGQFSSSNLGISQTMFDELYADLPANYLTSHNHYRNCWGSSETADHVLYRTVKKYWWDDSKDDAPGSSSSSSDQVYRKLIPMLRMSEIYLIAMETAGLAEANQLFSDYMKEHSVASVLLTEFTSLEKVRAFVLDEYRREFYAEGQMFYTYKRRGETSIKWYDEVAGENTYVLPLPETEYNPNL